MFTTLTSRLHRFSTRTGRKIMSKNPHQSNQVSDGFSASRRCPDTTERTRTWSSHRPQHYNPLAPQYFCLNQPYYGHCAYLSNSAPSCLGPGRSQQRHCSTQRSSGNNTPRRKRTPDIERIGFGQRYWEKVSDSRAHRGKGVDFKLLSFNVLAQDLLNKHPELYRGHKSQYLTWQSRWQKILAEIKRHRCDILCLQEVQQSHLTDFYRKQLESLGYNTKLFKQRTSDCPDGCAIFYKSNALQLVEHEMVEFRRPGVSILNRDNVGIIARFAPVLSPKDQFIVSTTHLLYNPKREDVRIAQIQLFLTEIERLAFDKKQKSGYLPVILTGDFNSTPDSSLLTFLRSSVLDFGLVTRKSEWIPPNLGITDNCQHLELMKARHQSKLSREEEAKLILSGRKKVGSAAEDSEYFRTGRLSHNFNFNSAYDYRNGGECTTFQDKWVSVDYILYSGKTSGVFGKTLEDRLVLLERYTLPGMRDMRSVTIPNDSLGSDHLSLLAQFRLIF